MWPSFVICITMGYLFHVWGGVGCWAFLGASFFLVINICTELFRFGRGI